MEKHFSVQQKLFYAQLIINSIVILLFSVMYRQPTSCLYLLCELLAVLIVNKNLPQSVEGINRLLQIIIQPVIIPISYSYLLILLHGSIFGHGNNFLVLVVTIIYSLLMFIPYTYLFLTPIKTVLMRIFILIFSFLFTASGALDLMVTKTFLSSVPLIQTLSNSIFDGAIITAIMIIIAMHSWGYGFPNYRFRTNSSIWIIALLIAFTVWFAFWNAFSSGSTLLSSLYTFKITNLNFSLDNILGGLEAGIAEEFIFRFGILTILIETLYNSRNKFILASLISSFLFGILHGINALAGQDLNNTIIQMIFAFSFGFYLAAIYLYTNCFYLNVIFHALIDTLVFLTSNNTVMSGKVSIGNLVGTVIEGAISIIIGYFLIKSKSKFDSTTYEFHLFK